MKIILIRIGDKYGPEYEEYLESKLSKYDLHWIREPYDERVTLQWNKMWGMQLDHMGAPVGLVKQQDEPICVMDIDVMLVGDYEKIFDYPIKRGQFLAMPGWWRDTEKEGYTINGGFFKYYPKDCKYIYDKFMDDIHGWQQHYIENGVTKGPVNGEQYFVEDSVKERLKLITLPNSWFTRWAVDELVEEEYSRSVTKWQVQITRKYQKVTGNDYIFLGGEFHPDIKLVHFTHRNNKPMDWKYYDEVRIR